MLEDIDVCCPYCGETFGTAVDCSAGNQQYIEDCQICCRPIIFQIEIDAEGQLANVNTLREDE